MKRLSLQFLASDAVASSRRSSVHLARRGSELERDAVSAFFAAVGLHDEPAAATADSEQHNEEQQQYEAELQELQRLDHEATAAFNSDDFRLALSLLTQSLSLSCSLHTPIYGCLLLKRSMTFAALELPQRALQDADKAVLLRPAAALPHYHRGIALQAMDRLHQAREAFVTALECIRADGEEASSQRDAESPVDADDAAMMAQALQELDALLAEMSATAQRLLASSACSKQELSRIASLTRWLQEADAMFPFLHIFTQPATQQRAVHVLTSLPPRTPVLIIPASRIITASQAASSPVGLYLASRSFPSSCTHSALACHLHWHLHCLPPASSPLSPYLAMLPPLSSFAMLPILYPKRCLRWLEGTTLPADAAAMMQELRREYDLLVAALSPAPSLLASVSSLLRLSSPRSEAAASAAGSAFPAASTAAFSPSLFLSSFSFELFLRYRLHILSRVFALQLEAGSEAELCLVPYADLLNHHSRDADSAGREAEWRWDASQQRLVMTTVEEVRTGEELQHDYGAKSNRRWLLHYGMVLSGSQHHAVVLSLSLSPSTPHYILKRDAMQRCSSSSGLPAYARPQPEQHELELTASTSSPCSRTALRLLRLYHATHTELLSVRRAGDGDEEAACGDGFSADNEAAVLSFLAFSARHALAFFTEDLEQDDGWWQRQRQRRERKARADGDGAATGRKGKQDEADVEKGQRRCLAQQRRRQQLLVMQYRREERRVWSWWERLDGDIRKRKRAWKRQAKKSRGAQADADTDDDEESEAEGNEPAPAPEAVDEYWQRVWLPMLRETAVQG